jgi:membrane-associated phospholipid phosphatase
MSDVDRRFRTSRRARPPSRPTLTIAAVLVVANLLLFALIAEDLLDGGGLISHDEAVLAWFVEHRTDALISAAKVVSTLGGFVSLAIVGALLGLWLWRRGWHVALAAAPVASLVLASLASTASKAVFDRERPPVVLHATTVTLAAFPSGHATDAAAFFVAASLTLAITIAHHRSTRALLVATGLFLALLVGLSRLVLGVHWLSDVVAGWALGTAVAIAIVVTLWYLSTRRQGVQAAPVS